MVYTQEEILRRIQPVLAKYQVPSAYLFGSYARGTATEQSDVDLLVDTTGTQLQSLFTLGALYCELEEALGKPIDLLTVSALTQQVQMPSEAEFCQTVWREKVPLYAVA